MVKMCSWCKKDLGYTEDHIEGDTTVTHTICKTCREEQIKLARESIKRSPKKIYMVNLK